MINFKTLAIGAAVLSGIVFAMPTPGQAMPQAVPVKIDAASNGNLVQVYYKRHCRYGRCYARYHRHGHYRYYRYSHYRPYYRYYRPYYGYYRPYYGYYPYHRYYRRPGIGLYFDF